LNNEQPKHGNLRASVRQFLGKKCEESQDPEDVIEAATVVHPRNATRLVGQHRPYGIPFTIGDLIATTLSLGVLNDRRPRNRNAFSPGPVSAILGAKRTSISPLSPVDSSKMTISGVVALAHTRSRSSAAFFARELSGVQPKTLDNFLDLPRVEPLAGSYQGNHRLATIAMGRDAGDAVGTVSRDVPVKGATALSQPLPQCCTFHQMSPYF
jgi:hypothetical protein